MSTTIKRNVSTIVIYGIIIVAAGIYLLPILYMLLGSLKPDDHVLSGVLNNPQYITENFSVQNFKDVFSRVNFERYLLNSLIITGCVVVFGLVVNAMAGYALARFHWRGRQLILALILSFLIILNPAQTGNQIQQPPGFMKNTLPISTSIRLPHTMPIHAKGSLWLMQRWWFWVHWNNPTPGRSTSCL